VRVNSPTESGFQQCRFNQGGHSGRLPAVSDDPSRENLNSAIPAGSNLKTVFPAGLTAETGRVPRGGDPFGAEDFGDDDLGEEDFGGALGAVAFWVGGGGFGTGFSA
jgi:hypothetical protein